MEVDMEKIIEMSSMELEVEWWTKAISKAYLNCLNFIYINNS